MMPIECSFGSGTSPPCSTDDRDFQVSRGAVCRQPNGHARANHRTGWVALFLGSATLLFAPELAAADPIAVQLEIRNCAFLDQTEVARVVRAELGVDPNADPASEPTHILAQCAGERLVLQVNDPVSRKLLRRNFALREPEHPGMSRLVGLAAAELVLASWAELSLKPIPSIEPEGAPASPAAASAARARVQRRQESRARPVSTLTAVRVEPGASPVPPGPSLAELPPDDESDRGTRSDPLPKGGSNFRALGLISARSFFTHDGVLWGGGARIGSEPLAYTSWALDTLFESGEVTLNRGAYRMDTWTVGGHVFAFARLPPVDFRFGGGLRAGFAASSATAGSGGTRAMAPWGWPLVTANVGVRASRYVLELSAEASYVVLPISGGPTGETIRGAWFSAQFGVGVVP